MCRPAKNQLLTYLIKRLSESCLDCRRKSGSRSSDFPAPETASTSTQGAPFILPASGEGRAPWDVALLACPLAPSRRAPQHGREHKQLTYLMWVIDH
jgi:hypothetical protein